MSTQDSPDDDKDIPDDISDAFTAHGTEWDRPETLEFDEDTVEKVCLPEMDNKNVGTVVYCETYDCLVYYSLRDENRHFYKKGKAYALSDEIVFKMDEMGAEKIFIGERFSRAVLEFDLEQYMEYEDGETMHHDNFGPQRYTPKANALRVWPNAVDAVPQ